jgi:hypothetical protein
VIGAKGTSDNHTMHAADVIARDLIIVVQTDQRLTELRLVVACEAAAAAGCSPRAVGKNF